MQTDPNESFVLRKPMEVRIPHYLTYLEEGDYEKYDITFAKADHTEDTSRTLSFRPLRNKCGEVEMQFITEGGKGYGILHSTHCCCLCITTCGDDQTKVEEQTSKASYCLTRLETPFQNHPRTVQITFIVSFMLPTCLEVSEDKQYVITV